MMCSESARISVPMCVDAEFKPSFYSFISSSFYVVQMFGCDGTHTARLVQRFVRRISNDS